MFRTIPRKSIGRSPRLRHVLKAARIGRCIQHRPELSRDRLLCRALFRCFFPRFRSGCQTLFRRFLRCLHGRCRTALRSHLFLRLRIRHLRSPLFFQRILQRLHSGFQSLNAPLIIKNHRLLLPSKCRIFRKIKKSEPLSLRTKVRIFDLVETEGFEPLTSRMRTERSPS